MKTYCSGSLMLLSRRPGGRRLEGAVWGLHSGVIKKKKITTQQRPSPAANASSKKGFWCHPANNTDARLSYCVSSVKTSGESLLGVTQCVALVMEIVLCITRRGRAAEEDRWDVLAAQYTVKGLKDLVMDTVLLQSITVAISYTGDKWRCSVNPMIKDVLSSV